MYTTQNYRLIDRQTLKAKLDRKDSFHLWNVLTQEFYKPEANLPGSRRFPLNEITEQAVLGRARKDDEIVVYCGSPQCPQSKQAAEKLGALGFTKIWAYEGGIQDWSEAGLPLVRLE